MSQRLRRARRRAASRNRPRPPLTLTLRALAPLRRDTRVRYSEDVASRKVDREAWAAVVEKLVLEEAGGNKTRFATLIGSTYKTVGRWLNRDVDVSEESVRAVAAAMHISPIEMLIRVGYYTPEDMTAPAVPDQDDDPVMAEILAADVTPRMKMRMVQRLVQLRASERTRQLEEVKFWISQAKGA